MIRALYMLIVWLLFLLSCGAQETHFGILGNKEYQKISFQLINNLIVIPVEINGLEMSFLLDSGVNTPILFNINETDSLNLNEVKEITLRGFGDGEPIKALHSIHNTFRIDDIYNGNQDMFVVLDKDINFSTRLGVPVHGILGYDIFKDFVVEINYSRKKMKFHNPDTYVYRSCRKCITLPISIANNKPYIDVNVDLPSHEDIPVKLLIDSGSSDAMWLFENEMEGIVVPEKNFDDFLGRGLNGSIFGKRSRVNQLRIGEFALDEAKVAFPDSVVLKYIREDSGRNGSLGSEVLMRFNVIMDYPGRSITLKKNSNFSKPFLYNMSGLELQHNGIRMVKELSTSFNSFRQDNNTNAVEIVLSQSFEFKLMPAIEIAEVRKDSPADVAGLKQGDMVLRVNGKDTHRYNLQEVTAFFQEKEGKRIRMLVERNGKELVFEFRLKKLL